MPLTVKIRAGWDRNSINAVEVLKLAEDCGVEALAIHGRTRCDMFSGQADWSVIALVKERARIPIMGNGDVFTPVDAERMFKETQVDGVMIGRGVLANPWLLRQCHDHLSGNPAAAVSQRDRPEMTSRIVAGAFEAFVAALYLDAGVAKTKEVIFRFFPPETTRFGASRNYKKELQELLQQGGLPAPRYEPESREGADHRPRFVYVVLIDGVVAGRGTGKNKADDTREAARQALECLRRRESPA